MSTLANIANTAAMVYLKRPDKLADAIEMAKKVYLLVCGKVPFHNLTYTSAEQAMTLGTRYYSMAAFSPAVAGLIAVSVTYASGQYRRLRRSDARAFEQMRATPSGRPYSYARWQDGIEVHPTPNSSSYTWRARYWTYPTIETSVGDTVLVTPTEWDELLEWETLYRLYSALGEHEKAYALMVAQPLPRQMSPKRTISFEIGIIPRLWNDLLLTVKQREAVDEDFSINPVMRSYTHG